MPTQLVKHGSAAGYRRELETDSVCERCRIANRVYQTQYTKRGRAAGIKYGKYDVIDHLYKGSGQARTRTRQDPANMPPRESRTSSGDATSPGPDPTGPDQDFTLTAEPRASLGDRIGDALKGFVGTKGPETYVPESDYPDYISPSDADPEPQGGEWSAPKDDEYVITKEGLLLIEDNLGTYLSVLGITLEMIDPYCGPILADNFENIIGRWTKVIARYPKAAKLFMSKDGGTLFLWIGAIQATWPVLLALYEHHLAKTVKINDLGQTVRVHPARSPNGRVDATLPDQQFNFTVD